MTKIKTISLKDIVKKECFYFDSDKEYNSSPFLVAEGSAIEIEEE